MKLFIINFKLSNCDFEDAIQYYTAIQNNIGTLLTRNIRDDKHAEISVLTPDAYLKSTPSL